MTMSCHEFQVQAMSLLWTLTFPISVLVCFAFWTLINPIWDLKMQPGFATQRQVLVNRLFTGRMTCFTSGWFMMCLKNHHTSGFSSHPQVLLTEHFFNMLVFIAEFLVNRNVFYLKHGIILYIYALLCPVTVLVL